MSNVYFKSVTHGDDISSTGRELLETIVSREGVELEKTVPLKVHFGEKGNKTFLPASTYNGIADFLSEHAVTSFFCETSVLYGGERFRRDKHTALALSHGFTRLPVVIADGANGEEACDVEVNLKHFKTCSVAKALAGSRQTIVCSHFKGHMLAGFGGAIKQLSMGFASKGGKMAMHLGVKPVVWNLFCKHCGLCVKRCAVNAITIEKGRTKIDHKKCLGCGACFSICPHHAVSVYTFSALRNALFGRSVFREKLVEYAYAAHTSKRNIYITFALNVTKGCDCEPRPMKPCIADIGVFASLDPVSIDAACFDAVAARGTKFKGRSQLSYAAEIGLGEDSYNLITL